MDRINDDFYMSNDYFQEKMDLLLGMTIDKNGDEYTFDKYKKFVYSDQGIRKIKFRRFMQTINLKGVSNTNKIYKYDSKYSITGVHQLMTDRLVNSIIPRFYKENKSYIREMKLDHLLD